MNSHIIPHIEAANRHFSAHEFEEAHQQFSQALHKLQKEEESGLINEESVAELYLLRGTSLVSVDEQAALADPDIFNQVLDDYDNAIDLHPEAIHYRNLRGRMYMNCTFSDYKKEARKDFEYVLKHQEHHPDALQMMGLLATQAKDYDKAIYYFSLAIEQEPEASETYAARGMSYFRKKPPKYEEAARDFAKAQSFTPEREDLYIWRAQCFQLLNLPESALQEYDRLIDLSPKAEYFVERGNLLIADQPGRAFEDYTHAVEIGQHPLAYNNLAWLLLQKGDFEEAIEHAKMVIQVDPTATIAYATLAEIYAKMEDEDRFYEYLALALQHYYEDYMDAMMEPAFEAYMHEARFKELIVAVQKKS